jgi:hypothetical protein
VQILVAVMAIQAVLVSIHFLLVAGGIDLDFVSVGGEQDVATWLTSLLFGLAAGAAMLLVKTSKRRLWPWGPIAAAMALFSLDEIAMLHERVEAELGSEWVVRFAEPVAALLVLVLAVSLLRRVRRRERLLLVAAAGVLFLAQLTAGINDAVELGNLSGDPVGAAEECLELLVGAFVLAAAGPPALEALGERQTAT